MSKLIYILTLTIILLSIQSAQAIYVPDDYAKIQWAVNNASVGDTIIVRDGKYYENINVNKSLTIKSEKGFENCTIYGVVAYGSVFNVTADHVNITGFTIQWTNYGDAIRVQADNCVISNNRILDKGIIVYKSNYTTIKNNVIEYAWGMSILYSNHITVENNVLFRNLNNLALDHSNFNTVVNNNCTSATGYGGRGLSFWNSNNNVILNNNFSLNHDEGVYLGYSNNNTIRNNKISDNRKGILLDKSNNNDILDNEISGNNRIGVEFHISNYNKMSGNTMTKNGVIIEGSALGNYIQEIDQSNLVNGKPVYYLKNCSGKVPGNAGQIILVNCTNVEVSNQDIRFSSVCIEVCFSSNVTITSNNCSSNFDGIELIFSNHNVVARNNCSSNLRHGILIDNSNDNVVRKNNVFSNKDHGICISASHNNLVYLNNFVNNHVNGATYWYSETTWNSSKTKYAYNGSVYSNYLGNYWSDYAGKDNDSDGIGETSYGFWKIDKFPLMRPSQNYNILPIAVISAPKECFVNQTVVFNASLSYDPDGFIVNYIWNFEEIKVTGQPIAKHSFPSAGNYTIKLTVTDNGNATNSTTMNITVRLRGDFNKNNEIDVCDASYVAYMLLMKVKQDLTADFNGNKRIDVGDLAKISYYVIGKITKLE